jgi:hypothetical protein
MDISRVRRSVLIAALFLALASATFAVDVVVRAFDDDPLEMPPLGFTFSKSRQATPGSWVVRAWGANHHLEHVADWASAKGLSLAITGPAIKDVQVFARLQLVDGERSGGVVWRYQDWNNFYGAMIDLRQPEVALFRVTGGNRIRLDQVTELDLDHDLSHTILVRHESDQIYVQLDGVRVLQVRDRGFVSAGRCGVVSGGAARTWFDDLRIADLSGARW